MADFFLDISAVGVSGEYQVYAATPTIGANATDRPRPMDGNGLAQSAAAAAVAIAELQVTTLPTDGQTLSIGGSGAITAKTTVAAKNQFAIGANIAAATTNLTNLINTYGTASNQCDVAAVAAVSQVLLAIPYLYWARVKPGTTDTIQLFTRIAGDNFNTNNNSTSKITQTGAWLNSGAASINFTEGANGPFGYFFHSSGTIFGKAVFTYGIAYSASSGPTNPGVDDNIFVRTQRSGSNLTIACTTATNNNFYLNGGTSPRHFIFDAGNTWPGDKGQFSIEITANHNIGNMSLIWSSDTSLHAEEQYGFRLWCTGTGNGSFLSFTAGGAGGSISAENCLFEESQLSANSSRLTTTRSVYAFNTATWNARKCKFSYKSTGSSVAAQSSGSSGGHITFDLCLFEYGAATSGIVDTAGFAGISADTEVVFVNCRFYDRNGIANPVLSQPITGTGMTGSTRIIFDGCDGVAPFTSSYAASIARQNSQIIYRMPGADGDWRVETGGWITEWRSGANIPYLNGVLPSGTPWSIKSMLRDMGNARVYVVPVTLNAQYRSVDAIKTLTVEILVPAGTAFKKSSLGLSITYTKTDGTISREDTLENYSLKARGTDTSVATSSAAWNMNGTTGYDKAQLAITTAYAIKSGTRVNIRVIHRGRPVGNVDRTIFINPEPTFS